MTPTITAVLCGIGGYGQQYLKHLLDTDNVPVQFTGFVDPHPKQSMYYEKIQTKQIPIYQSLEEFYQHAEAELAILASPIQFHCPQTVYALEHGSHVLCEKPLCGSLEEADRMLQAQRKSGKIVNIGYQWSYLPSTQKLKQDILSGSWGRPLNFKCLALWPRPLEYYSRNRWAGRIQDDAGRPVLDSPINNACSHYLHHMLYLLGDSPQTSARPQEVQAQVYRAHQIENYDTAFLRCICSNQTEILFAASHSSTEFYGPEFELTFEKGTLRYTAGRTEIGGITSNGKKRSYASEIRSSQGNPEKINNIIHAIHGSQEPLCGISAARSQTECITAAQKSGTPIGTIPDTLITRKPKDEKEWLEVNGLDDLLRKSFETGMLPDTSWADWIRPVEVVRCSDDINRE